MVERAEMLELALRLSIPLLFGILSIRYLVSHLDPLKDDKKKAKLRSEAILRALGIDPATVSLTDYELMVAQDIVVPNRNKDGVSFKDIGGCEEIVAEVKANVILPMKRASVWSTRSELLVPPKGVLLYGPPGCGKTMIAKAIAASAGARFISLQFSTLTDKWYGESQKLTNAIFSLARKVQPTIIFIDEIDSLLRSRTSHDHEATAMMKAQFLSLWDGFSTDRTAQVVVLGATNRPQEVDQGIMRRMPLRFNVPLPNLHQRQEILTVILKKEPLAQDVDIAAIAKSATACSGADLREVCRSAALLAMSDAATAGGDNDDDYHSCSSDMKLEICQRHLMHGVSRLLGVHFPDVQASVSTVARLVHKKADLRDDDVE